MSGILNRHGPVLLSAVRLFLSSELATALLDRAKGVLFTLGARFTGVSWQRVGALRRGGAYAICFGRGAREASVGMKLRTVAFLLRALLFFDIARIKSDAPRRFGHCGAARVFACFSINEYCGLKLLRSRIMVPHA